MRIIDIIRKKRDGQALTAEEINFFVGTYTSGGISDPQAAAWLMAVVLRGLNQFELAALTGAMLKSGDIMNLSSLPGKKVDKHSTGGVGDKTSLVVAAVAAAGGLVVPMICSRGWDYTGGTLDKLKSIPGFDVNLTLSGFRASLEACGCAMIDSPREIAPAEKKLSALSGGTGAFDTPWLICASIMSRKLAAGVDTLVLDVKFGSGALMKQPEDAEFLARLLVETAAIMGKKAVALLTNMNQPLGRAVGNALEVSECIDVLRGGGPADVRTLSLELCGWMFFLGECVASVDKGRELAAQLISDGRALQKFRALLRQQHGDDLVLDDRNRLPHAKFRRDLLSTASGCVAKIDGEQIGRACAMLGGGRLGPEDIVDPAVGLVLHKKTGDVVTNQEPLVTLHYNTAQQLDEACALVQEAFHLTNGARYMPQPLVTKVIECDTKQLAAEMANWQTQ
jgi:pyrimidine-nucleoside phosphorylase/thymidine phosphorylase